MVKEIWLKSCIACNVDMGGICWNIVHCTLNTPQARLCLSQFIIWYISPHPKFSVCLHRYIYIHIFRSKSSQTGAESYNAFNVCGYGDISIKNHKLLCVDKSCCHNFTFLLCNHTSCESWTRFDIPGVPL